ncbi:MAG: aminoacyl-tRNA hydrolase [Candidatus Omnitrophota bacterium]|nr:aminoacyl-tRNA hydrolase [Candidatus Omnitrophota bacterium]
MKLIVGLGNPGDIYANSRHNIGFISIKALAKKYKFSLKRDSNTLSMNAKGSFCREDVILAKPLTFMNLSGEAVKSLIKKYKVLLDDLLVICDDLDLEFGRIKIKPFGSSGGHRGLKSIIDLLESSRFARLKVGIGRPCRGVDPSEYVLAPFNKRENIKEAIDRISDCCEVWLAEGIEKAMNRFNVK